MSNPRNCEKIRIGLPHNIRQWLFEESQRQNISLSKLVEEIITNSMPAEAGDNNGQKSR